MDKFWTKWQLWLWKDVDFLQKLYILIFILGFSASLYAFYRDKNGKPRTPRDDRGNPPLDLKLRVRKWSENTIKKVHSKLIDYIIN